MKLNKVLAIILIAVLGAGLLTGCSSAEMGYFDLQQETAALKLYEVSGDITVDLKQLPEELTAGADAGQLMVLQSVLANFKLSYNGKVDLDKQMLEYNFYLEDQAGAQQELTRLIMDKNMLYVKIDELVKLAKSFGDADLTKEMDAALGEAEYLSIDLASLQQGVSGNSLMATPVGGNVNIFENAQAQQVLWQELFADLLTDVYDDFETGLVTKTGDKYTLTIAAEDAMGLFKSFATYSIEHAPQLGEVLKSFVNGLTDQEMQMLGLDSTMAAQFNSFADVVLADLAENKDLYLDKIAELDAEMEQELLDMFAGSKLISSLEKKNGTYESSMALQLKVTESGNTAEVLELEIASQSTIKPGATFEVSIPTTGVMSLEELQSATQEQAHQVKQVEQVLIIQTDSKSFTLSRGNEGITGEINVNLEKGITYLPLRQVAEIFGETVGWDTEKEQAFVDRDGSKVSITGKLISGRSYIKIRDFENLGYQVQWDGSTNTVTITK